MKEHNLNVMDFVLDEIESIELIGEEPTIDITVEDTHMFFANGIYTHNSGHELNVLEAGNVADSYRKIMTGDFIMSLSRRAGDKTEGTARIHILKNRFGTDGFTYPCSFDASCGKVLIYDHSSSEGQELLKKMEMGEKNEKNKEKKLIRGMWDTMMPD